MKALLLTALLLAGCTQAPKEPPEPTAMITTDGTFEVGTATVPAGTWKTSGTAATGVCLWIRRADQRVGSAELQRGRVTTGQSATVTLQAGEYFTTMDCSVWEHVDK